MSMREIRREPFTHDGRDYMLVVVNDGRRLTAVAERGGKGIRATRVGSQADLAPAAVDGLIDQAKRLLEKARPHRPA